MHELVPNQIHSYYEFGRWWYGYINHAGTEIRREQEDETFAIMNARELAHASNWKHVHYEKEEDNA